MRQLDVIGKQHAGDVAPSRGRGSDIVATDGELLMRFTRHGDQKAFAQIVERHGGLVWIVCREVLGHSQDVEDAFQATFIILAERAATIRGSHSAAAWLCKVAQRTSLAARRKRARLREESLTAEPPEQRDHDFALPDRELIYVLFDELRRLPERFQTPLVLRYMEGQSRRAIADQTDSTVAQIQGRLVRGRRMLRSRMLRRGVSLSLAAGAIAAAGSEASAAVTRGLAAVTATGCLTLKQTGAVVGFSAAALQLAKQGAKAMWLASMLKTATVLSTAVTCVAVAWAVEGGVGLQADDAERDGNQDRIEVRAAADAEAGQHEQAYVEKAANDAQKAAATARLEEKRQAELSKRMSELMQSLDSTLNNKAKLAAQVELKQINKSLLQRELEQWQDAKIRFEINIVGDKDESSGRDEMIQELAARISDGRHRLEQQAEVAAGMQAEVERLDAIAAQTRETIGELGRIELEAKYAATPVRTFESPVAGAFTAPPIVAEASVVSGTLSRGNTSGVASEPEKISPGDTVRIQVTNAFADQPIHDIYHVESMGTVALGPSYGRVNISGLSILEAEEAVKKHLATILELDPELQITLADKWQPSSIAPARVPVNVAPGIPTATLQPQFGRQNIDLTLDPNAILNQELLKRIDAMNSTIHELQAELVELKKRSQEKARATPASR